MPAWTIAKIAEMKRLRASGRTSAEVALILGPQFTAADVDAQMFEITKVPDARQWSDEQIATLTRLWSRGVSSQKIADLLGNEITREAVVSCVNRLDLRGPDGLTPNERKERNRDRIKAAYADKRVGT